ncbi:MAG: hypothetical protein V1889_00610 [archaeon]
MRVGKKGQLDLLNIICGLIVICGGVAISFGMVNLGSFVATVGLMLEIFKLIVEKGVW